MIDFPNSPEIGDTFTDSGKSWEWDGEKWISIVQAGPTGATGATGPIGATGPAGEGGGGSADIQDIWMYGGI